MLEFMQDQASIKDVADQLDEDQNSVVNNQPEVITTATEEISQESCAKDVYKRQVISWSMSIRTPIRHSLN